jgi:ABC-type histidine transport system ATPase subunit
MDLPGNARIRDFMDKLTSTTNVSKYVELPMIAVMGDTSSGKSSLLSSISVVELPSNSNLTTRCPIMLRMSKSDKKYATVAIQWKQKPALVLEADLDFPVVTIGEHLWGSLTNVIEKAQQHIIKFTGKEVARDCVRVNVFAPNCHDLTLIDLPEL